MARAKVGSLMSVSISTTSTRGSRPARSSLMRAASACGSWNTPPVVPIDDIPRRGMNTVSGPEARFSLAAMRRPSAAHSSRLVRIRVTAGLCR